MCAIRPIEEVRVYSRNAENRTKFVEFMQGQVATIAGGTSEIQRGIIATRGLGLPKT